LAGLGWHGRVRVA